MSKIQATTKGSTAGGSGYSVVQDEGTPLTARSTINFVGAGVTATDSGSVTTVTIPGGGGGGSITITRATITVPANTAGEYTATVTDGAATAASKVHCQLSINTATDQNGTDELAGMNVFALPASGSVAFTLTKPTWFVGPFYVDYFLA